MTSFHHGAHNIWAYICDVSNHWSLVLRATLFRVTPNQVCFQRHYSSLITATWLYAIINPEVFIFSAAAADQADFFLFKYVLHLVSRTPLLLFFLSVAAPSQSFAGSSSKFLIFHLTLLVNFPPDFKYHLYANGTQIKAFLFESLLWTLYMYIQLPIWYV